MPVTDEREGVPESARLLRDWTRFAFEAWGNASAVPPSGSAPFGDLCRFGVGPLMFRLLQDRDDERAGEFTDIHRSTAARNLVLFSRVASARDRLTSRGITPVLIKGGACLLMHHADTIGARTLGDLDLLVAPHSFADATRELVAAGWVRTNPELRYSRQAAPAVTFAAGNVSGFTPYLDLHRHVAQWPLLRRLTPRLISGSRTLVGWTAATGSHAALLVGVHRARHAFSNDGRDLFDLAAVTQRLDDAEWTETLHEARDLGILPALRGALHQATWWFGDGSGSAKRSVEVGRLLGRTRTALMDRLAHPMRALAGRSPWGGPLGRNLLVFPAAFSAPFSSFAAAALFLPLRILEGGRPTQL